MRIEINCPVCGAAIMFDPDDYDIEGMEFVSDEDKGYFDYDVICDKCFNPFFTSIVTAAVEVKVHDPNYSNKAKVHKFPTFPNELSSAVDKDYEWENE